MKKKKKKTIWIQDGKLAKNFNIDIEKEMLS